MPFDSIHEFPTNSSCSLGAVRPAGHHSDSSQAEFEGGAWFLGNVGSPSLSVPRADHLDLRGFEIYDIGSASVAALSDQPPPADATAQGPGGESLLLSSDNEEDLFLSSESAGGSE